MSRKYQIKRRRVLCYFQSLYNVGDTNIYLKWKHTIYPNVLLNQSKHIISAFECIAIIEVFCYLNKYLKCWYKWFCFKKNNSEHVQLVFSFSFNLYLTSIINCLLLEMVCVLVLYNSATIETSENQNDVFNTLLDSNK
jgi:hypothetical protein